ncbi:MAG: alpha/beta fold hydrolase [Hyphomicrobiales bacterium]|nr:alpha/beta fold hydrolase [Hyphomicrobiales bacterium]
MNAPAPNVAERLRLEVERAIQRGVKGVEYLGSGAPAVGLTSKDTLAARGTMRLYHYHSQTDDVYRVPVLIVMATTNRGYILDLAPGNSFVEFLLKRGYDVFMLDWTAPSPAEKGLRIEDYVLDFIPECMRRVRQETGEQDVTVVGYCFGGVLSVIYSSLHLDDGPTNLVCFTTPVDFSKMTLFQNWSDQRYFDVDRMVDSFGNVPPEMIFASFEMLRPASRAASQVTLWDNIWNDEFVRSFRLYDRWANDTLPLAGEYFRQTTKELMWGNKLLSHELEIGGRRVDYTKIKAPVLHAVAEHDHIIPYDAARPLIANIGSKDKTEVMLKGGHVSLVAGANAVKRLWPKLDEWMGVRSI